MGCNNNTYYVEEGDTQTLMYIIIILFNAAFILFTALTTESFVDYKEYYTSNKI